MHIGRRWLWALLGGAVLLLLGAWWRARRRTLVSLRGARLRQHYQTVPAQESIFVSVVACEPWRDGGGGSQHLVDRLCATVAHLVARAYCPARVFVAVSQPLATDAFLARYRRAAQRIAPHVAHHAASNVRVLQERRDEARGVSNARHMLERHAYRQERYYAVLASGALLCADWDVLAVRQLERCAASRAHAPVLCMAAPPLPKQGDTTDAPDALPTYAAFARWSRRYRTPQWQTRVFRHAPVRAFAALAWSSQFSFAHAAMLRRVPHDPWLHHVPRQVYEFAMAARLYTAGYECLSPCSGFIQTLARDAPAIRAPARDTHAAMQRVHTLLELLPAERRVPLEPPYGLGTQRTLDAFKQHTGVDYLHQTVAPHARLGLSLRAAPGAAAAADTAFPYETEQVVSKYGSWTALFDVMADARRAARPPPPPPARKRRASVQSMYHAQ